MMLSNVVSFSDEWIPCQGLIGIITAAYCISSPIDLSFNAPKALHTSTLPGPSNTPKTHKRNETDYVTLPKEVQQSCFRVTETSISKEKRAQKVHRVANLGIFRTMKSFGQESRRIASWVLHIFNLHFGRSLMRNDMRCYAFLSHSPIAALRKHHHEWCHQDMSSRQSCNINLMSSRKFVSI